MAFPTTSLFDELESAFPVGEAGFAATSTGTGLDFDIPFPVSPSSESPSHESTDSGISLCGDTSPLWCPDFELSNYDADIDEAENAAKILEELESVDLTVMQKPRPSPTKRLHSESDMSGSFELSSPKSGKSQISDDVTKLLDTAFGVTPITSSFESIATRDEVISVCGSTSSHGLSDSDSDNPFPKANMNFVIPKTPVAKTLDMKKVKILGVVKAQVDSKAKDVKTAGKPVRQSPRVPSVINTIVKTVKVQDLVTKEDEDRVFQRNSKGAVLARLNRQKKKEYVTGIEKENEQLKRENSVMKSKLSVWEREKESYVDEIAYLKSVLANQSSLSSLLQNVQGVKSVNLSKSFERKRQASSSEESEPVAKQARGGVCLHVVDKDRVSLEFCSKCSKNAS